MSAYSKRSDERSENVNGFFSKIGDLSKKKRYTFICSILSLVFWVGVWWLLVLYVGKEWILPSPASVFEAFIGALRGGELFIRVFGSLAGILMGFVGGTVCGLLLAALTYKVKGLHILFSPLLSVVKATPVASFILILWVFLERENVPGVASGLIVLPIVWSNCEAGFASRDGKLHETAKLYGFSLFKRFKMLYFPAVYPYFSSATSTAMGMAWKAGIAAEVLCTPDKTVGQMIWYSKRDIQTPDLFAWTFAVILFSFLLEKLWAFLLSLPLRRKKDEKKNAKKEERT